MFRIPVVYKRGKGVDALGLKNSLLGIFWSQNKSIVTKKRVQKREISIILPAKKANIVNILS